MPKVSVIIPNYNHAPFLEQRIQTVLDQTYQDFEVIYLDDASTDHSNEVFSKFADYPNIVSIFNSVNSGSTFKQWNRGIKRAKGEYIWIAESDDYADHTFLETLVPLLEQNQNVGVAYCQSCEINSCGDVIGTMEHWTNDLSQKRWQYDFVNCGLNECQNYLAIKNTIPNASAVIFRRSLYEAIDYADESMFLCGDWMTWIKLLLRSDIAFSAKPLNYYRSHGSSVRSTSRPVGLDAFERMQIFLLIREHTEIPQLILEQVQSQRIAEWVNLMLARHNHVTFGQTVRFYKLLKSCNSKAEYPFLKQITAYILAKLQQKINIFT